MPHFKTWDHIYYDAAETDAFDFAAADDGATSVDYDDDGDLDLYVINSPGGDSGLLRGDEPGIDGRIVILVDSDGTKDGGGTSAGSWTWGQGDWNGDGVF